MKYFFDTEFIEDGHTIDLISIGVVAEDGREYYAVNRTFDRFALFKSPWLIQNVVPHLPMRKYDEDKPWSWTNFDDRRDDAWQYREEIAVNLVNFFGASPEIWAYYADYDWVALCQLYGRMIDLPNTWPKYCRDLKQLADMFGIRFSKQVTSEHHALADARWVRDCYRQIVTNTPCRQP